MVLPARSGLRSARTRFLDDGRICLSNNAAERALRGVALGRRAWLFAGSDRGGERAAVIYSLIVTAKLNGIDPQAWLADVLRRIADHPASQSASMVSAGWLRRFTISEIGSPTTIRAGRLSAVRLSEPAS
jgi:transposase